MTTHQCAFGISTTDRCLTEGVQRCDGPLGVPERSRWFCEEHALNCRSHGHSRGEEARRKEAAS